MTELRLDRAGRRRSPATMPGFLAGRPPRNKGLRYPADPPKVVEIIAVRRVAGDGAHGRRAASSDRHPVASRAAHPRRARPHRGRPRSATRLAARSPRQGRTAPEGRYGRLGLARAPALAGAPRRTSRRSAVLRHQRADRRPDHQLRHAHAVEMAREGVPLIVIQRQLGHNKPRHHLRLPARHRQRGDHRDRPCPARAHGSRPRIATAMKTARLRVAQSDGPRQGAERDGCVS